MKTEVKVAGRNPSEEIVREKVLELMAQYLDLNYGGEILAAQTGKAVDPIPREYHAMARRIQGNPEFAAALTDLLSPEKTAAALKVMDRIVTKDRDNREGWAVAVSRLEVELLSFVREQKIPSIDASPVLRAVRDYKSDTRRSRFESGLGSLVARLNLPDKLEPAA